MKKTFIITLMLLALILAGCGNASDPRIEVLEEQVSQLQAQVALLQEQIEGIEVPEPDFGQDYDPIAELTIYDWSFENGMLIFRNSFAQAMSLAKADGSIPQVTEARTVLTCNGQELYWEAFAMHPGEAEDSYEAELEFFGYELLDLIEGDTLELTIEITLSDGQVLIGWGSSWEYSDGQLLMTAG